jgi:outer membrane lipoprotein-sorting protein
MRYRLPFIAGAVALAAAQAATPPSARAQDLTEVSQIVEGANLAAYYAGADGRARVHMTITDSQGRERARDFVILRRDVSDGGDQDYVVLFSRPADVRNTVFLVKKHVDSDDDRWLYLPDLDLVRRIAAGDKRTSFVGSHFLYEDVSGRRLSEDRHELVETTVSHYVVKSTPVDPGAQEFAHWTAWIDKATMLPTRMDYVDESGEVYRRIEALEIDEIGGHPTVTRMRASDLRSGGHTVSEFAPPRRWPRSRRGPSRRRWRHRTWRSTASGSSVPAPASWPTRCSRTTSF